MSPDSFHINLYDVAFLGAMFTRLNCALLLAFTKRTSRSANKFLALALLVMVLRMAQLPLQFSLALGPLIYFYVLKLTRPEYKFGRKDLLHFIPVIPEQFILSNLVAQSLTFVSVMVYLYCSHRLIERFYKRLKFNGGDRYRCELRWLHRLLAGFALLWLLWIPYTVISYYYNLNGQAHDPFYLCVSTMLIWIAVSVHLRPEISVPIIPPAFLKSTLPAELKQRGAWLKQVMKVGLYYQDPELSLRISIDAFLLNKIV